MGKDKWVPRGGGLVLDDLKKSGLTVDEYVDHRQVGTKVQEAGGLLCLLEEAAFRGAKRYDDHRQRQADWLDRLARRGKK